MADFSFLLPPAQSCVGERCSLTKVRKCYLSADGSAFYCSKLDGWRWKSRTSCFRHKSVSSRLSALRKSRRGRNLHYMLYCTSIAEGVNVQSFLARLMVSVHCLGGSKFEIPSFLDPPLSLLLLRIICPLSFLSRVCVICSSSSRANRGEIGWRESVICPASLSYPHADILHRVYQN